MRRIIRTLAIAFASIVMLGFCAILYSFSRTVPLAKRQPLSGGAIQVKDGLVSAAIIPSGDRQVILVDCGNDSKANAILRELDGMALKKESVKAILLTHDHPDHVAGCGVFPEAEIFAMAPERPLLEGRVAAQSVFGFLMGKKNSGIRITRYLQDGESLALGNLVVSAYLIPGHTAGSAAYVAAGTLYLGDSADAGKDGTLLRAKRFVSNDIEENQNSLEALADRLRPQAEQIKFMEFGHSGPLIGIGPLLDFAKSRNLKRTTE